MYFSINVYISDSLKIPKNLMVWISLKRDEDSPKKLVAMAGSGANLPPKGQAPGWRSPCLRSSTLPNRYPWWVINHENVGKYICKYTIVPMDPWDYWYDILQSTLRISWEVSNGRVEERTCMTSGRVLVNTKWPVPLRGFRILGAV